MNISNNKQINVFIEVCSYLSVLEYYKELESEMFKGTHFKAKGQGWPLETATIC